MCLDVVRVNGGHQLEGKQTSWHEPEKDRVADKGERCSDEEGRAKAAYLGSIPANHRTNHPPN